MGGLLACLIQLSQLIGKPVSGATLLAGLPTVNNQLTLELFPRAAEKLGLFSRLRSFKLQKNTGQYSIPLVLLLNDETACLLLEINGQTARIFDPLKNQIMEVSLSSLNALYSGQAFISEPRMNFSSRSSSVGIAQAQGNTSSPNNNNGEKMWFWGAIRELWGSYSEMLIASFLINLFALAVPMFTMIVYDRVIPNQSFDTLWVLFGGIAIVLGFDIVMRMLRSHFIDQAGKKVDLQVSANILQKVLGIRIVSLPSSVGAFADTIQSFDSVRDFITSTTVALLVDLPFSVLFLIVIGIVGGPVIWVPLILAPSVIIFGLLLQRPLIRYTKMAQQYSSEKQAVLYEALNSIESVKALSAEGVMQTRWERVTDLASQLGVKLRFIVNLGVHFSILAQQLATILVVIVGVYAISQNELTTGGLIACTILTSRALAPLSQIAALLTRYHQTTTSLGRLNEVMQLPGEHPGNLVAMQVPILKGALDIHDVTVSYSDRNAAALQNISLQIKPGEHVAIVGSIGSGKSTIAKVIMGLLQPDTGSVFFDGIEQTHFELTDLRKKIGYVPQDVVLFYGTLRDNITFGAPQATDPAILRAIQVAKINEFIIPYVGSYESMIAEGGKTLSNGQRQLIAIARATLLDPPILVFDEPTSSMDQQSEAALRASLQPYLVNKTFVLMTHRDSLLSLVDRLVVINAGKIVADGPKDAVLKALAAGEIKVPKGTS